MQRVAVTGCSGNFARALLPLLEADPEIEQIVGIDRVPPAGTYEKLRFYQYDIRDPQIQEALHGCNVLVHLAFVVVRPYSLSLQETASINLGGTWNVCEAAALAGIRKLIVSSSVAAYGDLPDNPEMLDEKSPLRGLYTDFYYSQHKHANELWLNSFQLIFPDIILSRPRPCIVIGPHQGSSVLFVQSENKHLSTASALQGRLQFIHEDDLASALQVMIRHDLPGAYNIVGDGPAPMPVIAASAGLQVIEVPDKVIYQQVAEGWRSGAIPFGPEWAKGDVNIACSNEKMKATGLWTPRYDTMQAFATTVQALT